ncbi:MAG: pyridoxal 5'-phosphate synthase glutaminase subunit PdxT [Fimbriimonadaceae bacterium]|nr:pyridoxal 5'-phosphate synthase glutaminase subunit PdxT [Fimbriimonadaceae bacterium]
MANTVGIVAIQGDFERHGVAVEACGGSVQWVKTPDDLAGVDRVIIPGGESTTVGKLMERFGLGAALVQRAQAGMPIWGTCMGMILMAREVVGHDQFRLGLLDITVERNAFGAQVHSFEDDVEFHPLAEKVRGVFIRAPIVVSYGPSVEVLSQFEGKVVAVRQGALVGTSFHPELTDDHRIHCWFLEL